MHSWHRRYLNQCAMARPVQDMQPVSLVEAGGRVDELSGESPMAPKGCKETPRGRREVGRCFFFFAFCVFFSFKHYYLLVVAFSFFF